MPEIIEDAWLAEGPRGRRLCWAVLRPDLSAMPGWWDALRGGAADPARLVPELAEALASTNLDDLLRDDPLTLLDGLDATTGSAMYWQPPDGQDQALAHPEITAMLVPFARAVARAAPEWWSAPVDLTAQRYAQYGDPAPAPPPTLIGAADRLASWHVEVLEEEARFAGYSEDVSGSWWSTPGFGALGTTRALPELGAVALVGVEDGFGWRFAECVPLEPQREPRVYEIAGSRDWIELVARYPLELTMSRRYVWHQTTGATGPWVIPDYQAVSRDFDAVHLTARAYLEAAGLALDIGGGQLTVLAGWNPDVTWWLTDCLRPGGQPERWALVERGHRDVWTRMPEFSSTDATAP
jgi:hypothetical protein